MTKIRDYLYFDLLYAVKFYSINRKLFVRPRRSRRGIRGLGRQTASQLRNKEHLQNTAAARIQRNVNFRNRQTHFRENLQKFQSFTCSNCFGTFIQDKFFDKKVYTFSAKEIPINLQQLII